MCNASFRAGKITDTRSACSMLGGVASNSSSDGVARSRKDNIAGGIHHGTAATKATTIGEIVVSTTQTLLSSLHVDTPHVSTPPH